MKSYSCALSTPQIDYTELIILVSRMFYSLSLSGSDSSEEEQLSWSTGIMSRLWLMWVVMTSGNFCRENHLMVLWPFSRSQPFSSGGHVCEAFFHICVTKFARFIFSRSTDWQGGRLLESVSFIFFLVAGGDIVVHTVVGRTCVLLYSRKLP